MTWYCAPNKPWFLRSWPLSLPMIKAYIMNELLALFNQIRRLEIITPQGRAGISAKESNFVFNYHHDSSPSASVTHFLLRKHSFFDLILV
jgi:hypothetical protein